MNRHRADYLRPLPVPCGYHRILGFGGDPYRSFQPVKLNGRSSRHRGLQVQGVLDHYSQYFQSPIKMREEYVTAYFASTPADLQPQATYQPLYPP